MPIVLWILAVLQILAGLLILATAKGAIHEILGILPIGFGILTIGQAHIILALRP